MYKSVVSQIKLTFGEKLIESLPKKSSFYDNHERRAYLRFVEIAKRIMDDPNIIQSGIKFIKAHMRDDPHQARAYTRWAEILKQPPAAIVTSLLEDSPSGQWLRDTAPVFVVVDSQTVQDIWRTPQ